jgi:hypothetical protein
VTKFILIFFFLAAPSLFSGEWKSSAQEKSFRETNLVQTDQKANTSSGENSVLEMNEYENDFVLLPPLFHNITTLAFTYSPGFPAYSLAFDVIPRPPEA